MFLWFFRFTVLPFYFLLFLQAFIFIFFHFSFFSLQFSSSFVLFEFVPTWVCFPSDFHLIFTWFPNVSSVHFALTLFSHFIFMKIELLGVICFRGGMLIFFTFNWGEEICFWIMQIIVFQVGVEGGEGRGCVSVDFESDFWFIKSLKGLWAENFCLYLPISDEIQLGPAFVAAADYDLTTSPFESSIPLTCFSFNSIFYFLLIIFVFKLFFVFI